MQEKISDRGTFRTPNASRYLQQLCKHFAHKIEVRFDEKSGEAALPMGPARLTATDDLLTVDVCADDPEGLDRARHVIDDHLARFAHREDFQSMAWDAR